MNDLEKRLQQSSAAPRRELSPEFTANLLQSLDKKAEKRPKWKEYIPVKFHKKFHKPAIVTAAFAATLVVGGTAYAAVGGLNGIAALFGGQKDLSGGARIVKVETQNCPHVDAFNITDRNRSANSSYYYKINADSKLSNQQVVDMVQGACEADAESIANGRTEAAVSALPENKDKLVGGYIDSVVTAVTPTSLSIRSDIPYVSNQGTTTHPVSQTFGHIDPNAVVVSDGMKQSMSTLKVGDHVSVSYRASGGALAQSETIDPNQIDWSAQTVVIVIRISPHMSDYFSYGKYDHHDFEQVVPCATTNVGYCTFDQCQHK